MKNIPNKLIEVGEYTGEGYRPVVDYGSWRVAVLNYSDTLLPQYLKEMQRHDETDEVFVLLRGRCILFVADGDQHIEEVFGIDMEPLKLYNIKRAVWHNHTLDKDAMVLVIENRDTTHENSPFCPLPETEQQMIVDITRKMWNER